MTRTSMGASCGSSLSPSCSSSALEIAASLSSGANCSVKLRGRIVAGKSGLIDDDTAAQLLRQQLHQVRERNALTDHSVTFRLIELTTSARAAAKAFDSVGVSVARFCRMDFGAVLRDDQRKHGKVSGFAVKRELKAIGQKCLEHERPSTDAINPATLLHLVNRRFSDFRINIEALQVQPVWPSGDLVVLNCVSHSKETMKREVC